MSTRANVGPKTDEELVEEAHQADLKREEEKLTLGFDKPKKLKNRYGKRGLDPRSALLARFDEDYTSDGPHYTIHT